ncbi:uncharacterized protein SPSK_06698 [Sporothrix schenckii 1099-18]|uniref:Uncharacterized protein n=1 Tax=Sporothrix schenckii 1099-18 TaxID=1397361 RepID=A0A0F2MI35_SPOSC|nr:uncharacterized protein SPSK_06698 [Sporothrix schenckii 1099-18]KJR89363.1 hypothetical protein SPSK_06698 [Sporothrix schenckii 1099-18]
MCRRKEGRSVVVVVVVERGKEQEEMEGKVPKRGVIKPAKKESCGRQEKGQRKRRPKLRKNGWRSVLVALCIYGGRHKKKYEIRSITEGEANILVVGSGCGRYLCRNIQCIGTFNGAVGGWAIPCSRRRCPDECDSGPGSKTYEICGADNSQKKAASAAASRRQ